MRHAAAAALVAVLVAVGFTASPARAQGAAPPGYTLKWSDDFDGPAGPVDSSRWNFRTDCKLASAQLAENVALDGAGNATIALNNTPTTCNDKQYNQTGGGLVSKQAFRYGYYEARIKGPAAPYWHSAFWLMAGDGSSTFGVPDTTEIDGPEFESQHRNQMDYKVFGWSNSGVIDVYYSGVVPKLPASFDTAAWHVYGIEWLENSIAVYVDGALQWSTPYRQSDWIHNRLNIWLTSIAVDGANAGLPDAMVVDYVRFYERDLYVDTESPDSGSYAETGTWVADSLATQLYALSGSAVDGSEAPPPASWAGYSYSTSRTTNTPGATATWTPQVDATQDYRVLVWNVVAPDGDPAATIDVNAATSGSTSVDQTSGASGWVDLGTFTFNAGNSGNVTLTASGAGNTRTNVVKFVATESVVGPRSHGYTEPSGAWMDSTVAGYLSDPERFSNSPGAAAVYTPNLPLAGYYDVYVWVTQNANADPSELVSVCKPKANRGCESANTTLNGQALATGWQKVDESFFNSGTVADARAGDSGGTVTLSFSGANNTFLRVGAVKFSYVHP